MSFSGNIWWNLAYPLTVNHVRLSAALTVICWHLRLGLRLGAFQIHTIRWRHSRLAPLTVTVTVSVAFRNVSIMDINNYISLIMGTHNPICISIIQLWTSLIQLSIQIWISVIQLWISVIHLRTSQRNSWKVEISIIAYMDITSIIAYGYPY